MSWFSSRRAKPAKESAFNTDDKPQNAFGGFGAVAHFDDGPLRDPRMANDFLERGTKNENIHTHSDTSSDGDDAGSEAESGSLSDDSFVGGPLMYESTCSDDSITVDTADPDSQDWNLRKANNFLQDFYDKEDLERVSQEQHRLRSTDDENDAESASSSDHSSEEGESDSETLEKSHSPLHKTCKDADICHEDQDLGTAKIDTATTLSSHDAKKFPIAPEIFDEGYGAEHDGYDVAPNESQIHECSETETSSQHVVVHDFSTASALRPAVAEARSFRNLDNSYSDVNLDATASFTTSLQESSTGSETFDRMDPNIDASKLGCDSASLDHEATFGSGNDRDPSRHMRGDFQGASAIDSAYGSLSDGSHNSKCNRGNHSGSGLGEMFGVGNALAANGGFGVSRCDEDKETSFNDSSSDLLVSGNSPVHNKHRHEADSSLELDALDCGGSRGDICPNQNELFSLERREAESREVGESTTPLQTEHSEKKVVSTFHEEYVVNIHDVRVALDSENELPSKDLPNDQDTPDKGNTDCVPTAIVKDRFSDKHSSAEIESLLCSGDESTGDGFLGERSSSHSSSEPRKPCDQSLQGEKEIFIDASREHICSDGNFQQDRQALYITNCVECSEDGVPFSGRFQSCLSQSKKQSSPSQSNRSGRGLRAFDVLEEIPLKDGCIESFSSRGSDGLHDSPNTRSGSAATSCFHPCHRRQESGGMESEGKRSCVFQDHSDNCHDASSSHLSRDEDESSRPEEEGFVPRGLVDDDDDECKSDDSNVDYVKSPTTAFEDDIYASRSGDFERESFMSAAPAVESSRRTDLSPAMEKRSNSLNAVVAPDTARLPALQTRSEQRSQQKGASAEGTILDHNSVGGLFRQAPVGGKREAIDQCCEHELTFWRPDPPESDRDTKSSKSCVSSGLVSTSNSCLSERSPVLEAGSGWKHSSISAREVISERNETIASSHLTNHQKTDLSFKSSFVAVEEANCEARSTRESKAEQDKRKQSPEDHPSENESEDVWYSQSKSLSGQQKGFFGLFVEKDESSSQSAAACSTKNENLELARKLLASGFDDDVSDSNNNANDYSETNNFRGLVGSKKLGGDLHVDDDRSSCDQFEPLFRRSEHPLKGRYPVDTRLESSSNSSSGSQLKVDRLESLKTLTPRNESNGREPKKRLTLADELGIEGFDDRETAEVTAQDLTSDNLESSCASPHDEHTAGETNRVLFRDQDDQEANSFDSTSTSSEDSDSDCGDENDAKIQYSATVVVKEAPLLRLQNCTSVTRSHIAEKKVSQKLNGKRWGWFKFGKSKDSQTSSHDFVENEQSHADLEAEATAESKSDEKDGAKLNASSPPLNKNSEHGTNDGDNSNLSQPLHTNAPEHPSQASQSSVATASTRGSADQKSVKPVADFFKPDDPTTTFFQSQTDSSKSSMLHKPTWKDEDSVVSKISAAKSTSNATNTSEATPSSDEPVIADVAVIHNPEVDAKVIEQKRKKERKSKKQKKKGLSAHFGNARKVNRHGDEVSVGTMNFKTKAIEHQHVVLSQTNFDDFVESASQRRPWETALKRSKKQPAKSLGVNCVISEGDEDEEDLTDAGSVTGLLRMEKEIPSLLETGSSQNAKPSEIVSMVELRKISYASDDISASKGRLLSSDNESDYDEETMDVLADMMSLSELESKLLEYGDCKEIDFEDMWDEVSADLSTAVEFERKKRQRDRRTFKKAMHRLKKNEEKHEKKNKRLRLFEQRLSTEGNPKNAKASFSSEFLTALQQVFEDSISSEDEDLSSGKGNSYIEVEDGASALKNDNNVSSETKKSILQKSRPEKKSRRVDNLCNTIYTEDEERNLVTVGDTISSSSSSFREASRKSGLSSTGTNCTGLKASSLKSKTTKSKASRTHKINPAEIFQVELKRQQAAKILSISNLRQEMYDRRGVSPDLLKREYDQHRRQCLAKRNESDKQLQRSSIDNAQKINLQARTVEFGKPESASDVFVDKTRYQNEGEFIDASRGHGHPQPLRSRWDSSESVSELDDLRTVMESPPTSRPSRVIEGASGLANGALNTSNDIFVFASNAAHNSMGVASNVTHGTVGAASSALRVVSTRAENAAIHLPNFATLSEVGGMPFRASFDDMPLTTIGEVEDYEDENEQGLLGASSDDKWDDATLGSKSYVSRSSKFSLGAKLPKVDLKIPKVGLSVGAGLKKMKQILPRMSKDRQGSNGMMMGDDGHGLLG